MEFELLDGYLLDGSPPKGEVVRRLLESPAPTPRAAPFYEGMRLLGARTPDLSLMALRLVLGGHDATDDAVVELRGFVEEARRGDESARDAYRKLVQSAPDAGTS